MDDFFETKYWNETLKTSNTSTSEHVFSMFWNMICLYLFAIIHRW